MLLIRADYDPFDVSLLANVLHLASSGASHSPKEGHHRFQRTIHLEILPGAPGDHLD